MELRLKICLQVFLWLWSERVLRDVAAGTRPTSKMTDSQLSNANLMFEFLLGGVEVDQDKNLLLLDKEMASMRSGRAFLSQINDNIPRKRDSMVQMTDLLEERRSSPMTQTQFDSLVLSMVYSAHQAWNQESREDMAAWGSVLLQLANATVHELRGHYLISYT